MVEFKLDEVLHASISQVMTKSNGKSLRIINDIADNILCETLYGDSLRLQQVLADFLSVAVNFTPSGGQLALSSKLTKDNLGESIQLAHLEFRYNSDYLLILT